MPENLDSNPMLLTFPQSLLTFLLITHILIVLILLIKISKERKKSSTYLIHVCRGPKSVKSIGEKSKKKYFQPAIFFVI